MADLGHLGNVGHNASCAPFLTVEIVGLQYRIATATVTDGRMTSKPVDNVMFDSVYEARAALRKMKAA